jgi:hypothetical protein
VCHVLFPTAAGANPLTADRGRPFGEGQVLGFPGADYYVGDLSHDLCVADPAAALSDEALLVFDGIACPLTGLKAGGIFPGGVGTVEFHDFPAAAWWGPGASNGAIQLRAPLFDPDLPSSSGVWAGVPYLCGTSLLLSGTEGVLSGAVRRKTHIGDDPEDTSWTAAWRARRILPGNTRLFGGALDLGSVTGDRWSALYGEWRQGIGNFNEWVFQTHLQRAKAGGTEARVAGGEIRYLFNMAGFIESQLSAGGDFLGLSEAGGGFKGKGKGFVQNTESFDALGLVMGDIEFRTDFERGWVPACSLAGGLQGHYGPAGLFASAELSPRRAMESGPRQHRGGLRFKPGDPFDAGGYLTEGFFRETGRFHGPGVFLNWDGRDIDLLMLERPVVALEAQDLRTARAGEVKEAGWSVSCTFFTGARLEYRNRCREKTGPLQEGSLEQSFGGGWFLQASATKPFKGSGERESASAGIRYDW